MDNADLDLTAYLDGYRVTYRGQVIWQGNTWTGAARAMTAAREAYAALLAERKAA